MSEIARLISEASARVEPSWTPEREARLRHGISHGIRRRNRQRASLVVALGASALALGFLLGRQPAGIALHGSANTASASARAALLELPDGSSVHAGSADARVETVAVGPTGVTLRLDSGTATFSVTPNPKRPFRVIARNVTVTVLGTIFSVGLEEHDVRVAVERGRVRVAGATGTRELTVGEAATFASSPTSDRSTFARVVEPEPAVTVPEPIPEPLPDTESSAVGPTASRPTSAPGQSWRILAKDQSYVAALARLTAEGPNAVHDTPEDLLLAADVARLGGRPDRAVAPLQRVIADHPFDPRAPLAAFTLGRTLLEQLGRPREAARAFATARRLDRGGTLTQDALAREVESWAGAGEAEQAHERALEYANLYPKGRRLAAVRRLGGLD
jgi:transmembrane sensor